MIDEALLVCQSEWKEMNVRAPNLGLQTWASVCLAAAYARCTEKQGKMKVFPRQQKEEQEEVVMVVALAEKNPAVSRL